jgi:hypothetical protein
MMLSEGDRNVLLEHAAVRRYRRGHLSLIRAMSHFVVLAGEVEIFVEHCHGRTVIARKRNRRARIVGRARSTASSVTVRDPWLGVVRKCALNLRKGIRILNSKALRARSFFGL